MLTFQIKGTQKLLKALGDVPKQTRRSTERALTKSAHLVERNAKQNLTGGRPLNVRSNTLRSSVRTKVDKTKLEARVGTNVVYGPVHEFGATIRPKRKKWLHWLGPAGEKIFAKKVVVPKRPWLQPAFDQAQARIKKFFKDEISGGLDRI